MPVGVLQEMPGVSEADTGRFNDTSARTVHPASSPMSPGRQRTAGGHRHLAGRSGIPPVQSERLVRAAGLAAQEDGFDPTKARDFR